MKSINFIAGLLIVSLAISCSGSKKQVKNKEQYPDIEDNSSARQYRNAHTNIIEKNKKFKEAIEKQQALAAQNDTVILSIERTPCFGRCPVFELKVYKNGYTTFEGKMNTDKQGLYMCNTKKEVLDSIFLRANTINFFNLQDEYDSPVTDLPSAYKHGWKNKKNTHQASGTLRII
jgi:hypothetical protein